MNITRRHFGTMAGAFLLGRGVPASASEARAVGVVLAPSNLGLRPQSTVQPGTWRAPEALMAAGLSSALSAAPVIRLERPVYELGPQAGTRIRNGVSIRAFTLRLAHEVRDLLNQNVFPVVIGGDCSVLLGGLYGLRLAGGRGLIHIDGHSDFYEMDADEPAGTLGAVAGMDLALASGRGETLLTAWPGIDAPLARDGDIIQLGQRDSTGDSSYLAETKISRITVQRVLREGVEVTVRRIQRQLDAASLSRVWLHVDFDVLDQAVMPAVDSPGSPGFNYRQLSDLIGGLCASGRIAGADFAIYDPARDPAARYARPLVECIAAGIGMLAPSATAPHSSHRSW